MKPRPWSFTALEDFKNCPRAYYEKRIAKSVQDAGSAATEFGTYVHNAFEMRQGHSRAALPTDLVGHEPFMQTLDALPGECFVERKVAVDRMLVPCGYFDKAVWWRGVLDWHKVDRTHCAIVDYKTGKPKPGFSQLKLFALWIFGRYPEITQVSARYYWTQTKLCTSNVYTRDQYHALWREFMPDLKQYVEAFKTDTWQPRPSGLCRGWCPVTSCEHWRPRKESR
jgi:hypothetical protein